MLLTLLAAVAMEPVAALAHRAYMHRPRGWRWHGSHHRPRVGRFERNDLFPLVFAAVTILLMALGAGGGDRGWLYDVGLGITLYGIGYALVHDVCVHGRLTGGRPVLPGPWLRWLAEAHAVHHRTAKAPYGFLVPVAPRRFRAATASLRLVDTRARVENTS